MLTKNAAGGKPALQSFTHLSPIGPSATGQNKRLTHRANRDGHNYLICQLRELPTTVRTYVCCAAHRGKDWFHRSKCLRRTAGHDSQFTSRGALGTAAHRRIQIRHAAGQVPLGMFHCLVRADRAHVNPRRSFGNGLGNALIEHQIRYRRAIRQHGDDYVCTLHCSNGSIR